MIISRFPPGQPVTERAIPTPIFNTEPKVRNYFLRKWSKDSSITDFDIRNFIDWDYYIDRFSTTVRKIVTIPAGIQNIDNPVSRVKEPDWLKKMMIRNRSLSSQKKISDMFHKSNRSVSQVLPFDQDNGIMDEPMDEPIIEPMDEPMDMAVEESTNQSTERQASSTTVSLVTPTLPKELPSKTRASIKRSDNFIEWLEQRKQIWLERTKRPNLTPTLTSTTHSYYQVLEILPCSNKNEVLFFVLNAAGQLQRLHIEVNHTLYINSKKPLEDKHLIPSSLVIPYQSEESKSCYLYSMTVKEDQVQDTLLALQKSYDIDSIEGIYNSKLPALFHVIMNTGCVCRIILPQSTSSLGILKHVTNITKGSISLQNVIMVNPDTNPYLTYFI